MKPNDLNKTQDMRLAVLKRQIEATQKMKMPELENKFLELYGIENRGATARNLRKRIAYRLQEILYGGLSEADAAKLDAIADADPLARLEALPARKLTKTQGTRFIRVWKGVTHEAIANGDGTFEYNGKTWKSLSAIAREITGTRWNGKFFFGVR